MPKLAIAALLLATLAGCGASPLHTAVSRQAAATHLLSTGTITITSGTQTDGKSPSPGHLLPATEDITLAGTDSDGKFTLVLHAVNPGGDLYVPRPDTVTLNGAALPAADYNALGKRLNAAKTPASARIAVYRASSILELAH